MRTRFEEQLSHLHQRLLTMGAYVENAIDMAVKALVTHDKELAEKTIAYDDEIDDLEKEIEHDCLSLILHQQPVASDLRQVSTVLKMITDLERIGDHAQDISEITILLINDTYIKSLEHIPMMAEAAKKMVSDSLDAYIKGDLELARAVKTADNVVDDLFVKVKDDLIDLIHEDAENGSQAMELLMVAKYLERIGDHAVNVSEWVVFSITGKHKKVQIL